MGGSIIINVFIYTKNCGSLVTSLVGSKANIVNSHNNLFEVYTHSGGSTGIFSGGLYAFYWF